MRSWRAVELSLKPRNPLDFPGIVLERDRVGRVYRVIGIVICSAKGTSTMGYPKVAHIHPRRFQLATRVKLFIYGEDYDTLPATWSAAVVDPAGIHQWSFVDATKSVASPFRIIAEFDLVTLLFEGGDEDPDGTSTHLDSAGDINVTVTNGSGLGTAPFSVTYHT